MPRSYCNLLYHIVFSTKQRESWLNREIRAQVHQYLGGAVKNERGIPFIAKGTADHVHILAKLRQDKAVSDVIRNIKANSSSWIHKTFPKCAGFHWQLGYGAFSVSQSQAQKTRTYIENQEEHHRGVSFQEEFVALLKRHEIEYDERYLWD